MRPLHRVGIVALAATSALVHAQYSPFLSDQPSVRQQIAMQPDAGLRSPTPPQSQTTSNVRISDVLTSQRTISVFASLTRDVDSVSSRLENQSTNTTLLAPINSAMSSLPRKPWEDPKDYAQLGTNAYEGNKGCERAAKNLERFVQAHIVPSSPWEAGTRVKSLAGEELWWETSGDTVLIMPGEVEVEKVAKQVGNGEIWILKGVVNYAG